MDSDFSSKLYFEDKSTFRFCNNFSKISVLELSRCSPGLLCQTICQLSLQKIVKEIHYFNWNSGGNKKVKILLILKSVNCKTLQIGLLKSQKSNWCLYKDFSMKIQAIVHAKGGENHVKSSLCVLEKIGSQFTCAAHITGSAVHIVCAAHIGLPKFQVFFIGQSHVIYK